MVHPMNKQTPVLGLFPLLYFLIVALSLVLPISTQAGPLNLSPLLGKQYSQLVSYCSDGFVFNLTLQNTSQLSLCSSNLLGLWLNCVMTCSPSSSFPLFVPIYPLLKATSMIF